MTIDAVSISRALQKDAEALSAFGSRLFRETYSADLTPADLAEYISKSFRAEHQGAEIVDPSGAVFIATVEGSEERIAGYAHLVAEDANVRSLFLNRLYVDANWRGLGLAGRLLDEVVRECRRCGADHLRLTVYEKNARAIAFYKRTGFLVTGQTSFTVGNEVQTDVEMTMPVGQNYAPPEVSAFGRDSETSLQCGVQPIEWDL